MSTLTITFDENDIATDVTVNFGSAPTLSIHPDLLGKEIVALLDKAVEVVKAFEKPE